MTDGTANPNEQGQDTMSTEIPLSKGKHHLCFILISAKSKYTIKLQITVIPTAIQITVFMNISDN